jgi:hypothetical protein
MAPVVAPMVAAPNVTAAATAKSLFRIALSSTALKQTAAEPIVATCAPHCHLPTSTNGAYITNGADVLHFSNGQRAALSNFELNSRSIWQAHVSEISRHARRARRLS